MAVLPMIYEPTQVLCQISQLVTQFDDALHILISDMFDTMYANYGCGLAAPQIGQLLAISVINMSGDISTHAKESIVLVNPQIIDKRGEQKLEAGCLSVPGAYGKVKRYEWVKVRAQDSKGRYFEITGDKMLGECLQHEIDHLSGTLFIDYLSPLKRKILIEKSRKFRKKLLKNKRN